MRFSELLAQRLRTNPGNPMITFYDDATGERTELSTTTYANWVAKTANVFLEELDLGVGDSVRIGTGVHWLTPIFIGAAWLTGMTRTDSESADLVIGGPEMATEPDALACSLHPFALPFPEPIAAHDFGALWPNQPDVFMGDPADSCELTATDVSDARLLTDLDPTAHPAAFEGVLRGGGSVVLVRNPDASRWGDHRRTEQATTDLRAE